MKFPRTTGWPQSQPKYHNPAASVKKSCWLVFAEVVSEVSEWKCGLMTAEMQTTELMHALVCQSQLVTLLLDIPWLFSCSSLETGMTGVEADRRGGGGLLHCVIHVV